LLARRCNWSDSERDRHDLQDITYRQPRSLALAVARVPQTAIAPASGRIRWPLIGLREQSGFVRGEFLIS